MLAEIVERLAECEPGAESRARVERAVVACAAEARNVRIVACAEAPAIREAQPRVAEARVGVDGLAQNIRRFVEVAECEHDLARACGHASIARPAPPRGAGDIGGTCVSGALDEETERAQHRVGVGLRVLPPVRDDRRGAVGAALLAQHVGERICGIAMRGLLREHAAQLGFGRGDVAGHAQRIAVSIARLDRLRAGCHRQYPAGT